MVGLLAVGFLLELILIGLLWSKISEQDHRLRNLSRRVKGDWF